LLRFWRFPARETAKLRVRLGRTRIGQHCNHKTICAIFSLQTGSSASADDADEVFEELEEIFGRSLPVPAAAAVVALALADVVLKGPSVP
jgi:hypothetical protein